MQMLADAQQANQYRCEISLRRNGNQLAFRSVVYSADMTKERIWEDRDCMCINERCLREFLTTDGITDRDRERGYRHYFTITYR